MDYGTKAHQFRSHGVEIDTAIGLVRRNGEEIYLRAKAQQLLCCLIENRSGPISKEDILREVWEGASVSDATIFGCIQEIRKALGDDARKPVFIRTMAKKGYWFVAPLDEEPVELESPGAPAPEPDPTPPAVKAPSRNWIYLTAAFLAVGASAVIGRAILHRPPAEMNYGEVAWWKMDEGSGREIRDSVTGLSAPLPAGVTWSQGVLGSALVLDGGSHIEGRDSGVLPRGSGPRSITAWIRAASTNADSTFIFRHGDLSPVPSGDSFNLSLLGNGKAQFWSGLSNAEPGPRVDDGQWHYIAGVFDGSPGRRLRLYVDGSERVSTVLPAQELQDSGNRGWAIGGMPWGGTSFRGLIDDVRVFDRPLSPAELYALHHCAVAPPDIAESNGEPLYFVPILGQDVEIVPASAGESSSSVRNTGSDHSGIDFVKRHSGCSMQSLRAADVGQNIRIGMDLRIGGSKETMGEGGPFFRSRNAAPGDGIVGGTSAGYWVQLQSDGRVRVRRLHPNAVVAFTEPIADFDPAVFHRLEVAASGEFATVSLDGKSLTFDEGGKPVAKVHIPALWETAEPKGSNRGSAGVAFSCYLNRGKLSGQLARNIRLEKVPDSPSQPQSGRLVTQ